MFEKAIDTSAPLHGLLQKRWSGVAFDATKTIEENALRSLVEAARWAPSCFNEQPWRYVICNKSSHPDAWQRAFDCLWERNQTWCQAAPVLIIECTKDNFSHNDQVNRWAFYDTGAASLSICLQATALGMMAHQMAGFDPQKARESFVIPDGFTPIAIIAIGYQLPLDAIPESLREKEMAARRRNPVEKHFFAGEWGVGV
jgi:nitroreductase